jgi:aldose 1-epimerase
MSGELKKDDWGKLPSGEQVDLYTLRNANGIEATITNYGGRIVTLKTPDRHGRFEDIVLGFDSLDGYLAKNPYFGALVGRYANRIANAEFTIGKKTYHLARNDGPNSLHGGLKGFDKVGWQGKPVHVDEGPAIELTYLSSDGEENYPGNLHVIVRYTLTNKNELKIDYRATTDKETILNLTNHSYFNLAGQAAGSILDHLVMINADEFTPVNEHLIPTGERRRVSGTPFDFRKLEPIGKRIGENDQQLKYGIGYDHNYILNRKPAALVPAARVTEPTTGRAIEVSTTEPGIQFYTGNHLDGSVRGKGGTIYGFRSGFCLETQHFPDSPHHPEFPSTALKPDQEYRSSTVFTFSIE